jgi:phage portal protein BeeE
LDKYDVFELPAGRGMPMPALVVIFQHRFLFDLLTIVVAPLVEALATEKTPRLRPNVHVTGRQYQVQLDRLAAIERRLLVKRVGDVLVDSDRIDVAGAMLLNGF